MARLHISLLGPLAVTLDSQPVADFESNKVRALLAYLATEQSHPHAREKLAELLWPDRPTGAALGNLRHVLANLRQVLDDRLATPHYLLATTDTLQLNPDADAWVDLTHFLALTAERAASPATVAACREAMVLYRGPFLQDFALDDSQEFEEWTAVVREQVERRVVQTLELLVSHSIEQGDYVLAVEWARRQVTLEPWNEEAHCQLMVLLALCGQRSTALHQFAVCKRLLLKELGVEPQPETLSLVERIRLDQVGRTDLRGVAFIGPQLSPSHRLAHNLPLQQMPFFGRGAELAQIAVNLADSHCRLLTIVGPGGVGKTRLAIEAASHQAVAFPQGTWFVPLATAEEESWVSAILHALNVPSQGSIPPWPLLVSFLEEKVLLLVLDNFEHLVDQADRVAELLAAAPRCKLLITSRVRLNISPEWLLPLEGLDVPPLSSHPSPAQEAPTASAAKLAWQRVESYSALQLFLHCVRRLQPDFAPMLEDVPILVHISQLLSGIPLAIELAATWVRILGLPAILTRLEVGLDLLATTLRDVPERHRSMRVVFDHSWQLLSAHEQRLMCQMAVFRGGCTASSAAAVIDASLLDLSGLVDKSWLRVLPSGRYEMHELVRQYAEARLLEAQVAPGGESVTEIRRRHCIYFANLLRERAGAINLHSALMADVLSDYANFLSAWQWAVENGEIAAAVDMVMTFYFAGDMLGTFHFTLDLFDGAAQAMASYFNTTGHDLKARQVAGLVLGWLHYARTWHLIYLGLLEQAQAENERNGALQARMPADDHQLEKLLLIDWAHAWLVYFRGHFGEARQRFRMMLRNFQRVHVDYTLYGEAVGAIFWQAHSEAALALVAWGAGRYRVAQRRMQRALALRDQIGEQRYRAFNLGNFARMWLCTGDFAQAGVAAHTALHLSESFGDQIGIAFGHLAIGRVEAAIGNFALAQSHFQQSEAAGRESGNHRLLMESITELGRLDLLLGCPEEAKHQFDEAMNIFEALGATHSNSLVGVVLGLGWAALSMHEVSVARLMFLRVPDMPGCMAWEASDATTGLAKLCFAENQLPEADALFAQVLRAPGTTYAIRVHVNQVVEGLGVALPKSFSQLQAAPCRHGHQMQLAHP